MGLAVIGIFFEVRTNLFFFLSLSPSLSLLPLLLTSLRFLYSPLLPDY